MESNTNTAPSAFRHSAAVPRPRRAIASGRINRPSWAGINIVTDGKPILGEVPGVPGFFNAIPADSGLTLGPIGARLVAEQVAGKSLSADIKPYGTDRFSRPT